MLKTVSTTITIGLILALWSIEARAVIPRPARIGGTVTVDGIGLTQSTDTGYTVKVTFQNGTQFSPSAQASALNAYNAYVIDIPIFHAQEQPGGATPGTFLKIHLYYNGTELNLTYPTDGEFQMGESGSIQSMDIEATGQGTPPPADNIVVLQIAEQFTADSDFDGTIYGTTGYNRVIVNQGAIVRCINFPGNNIYALTSDPGDVNVHRSGSTVIFRAIDGTRVEIPATTSQQFILFPPTTQLGLYIDNVTNDILLENKVGAQIQAVTTNETPVSIN